MSEPEAKRQRLQEDKVNKVPALPKEMLVRIFKELDYKTVCLARRTCKFWKDVIDKFEILQFASCKFISSQSIMVH